ncbi:actin-like [Sardina pilchardus]|uniref:actin-like n=1 Tax=Sardina pilchardus TaxID=27697 RepID=UPI002E109E0E
MAGQDFLDNMAVVIDPGSAHTKAGFSGEERPRAVVPSSARLPAYTPGESARDELRVCPQEHAVLVSDGPLAPPVERVRTAELLFEALGVPALYLSHRPLLSLYSYGMVTGLVVSAGGGATSVCPVYGGYCLPHAARTQPLGGAAVSALLQQLLEERGSGGGVSGKGQWEAPVGGISRKSQWEAPVGGVSGKGQWEGPVGVVSEEVQRQSVYVSQDFERELHQGSEVTEYRLPDGTSVALGDERFRCAELLFCPSLAALPQPGAHILALSSVAACAPQWPQEELLANVVLSGGTTLLPGFPERLQAELARLAPRDALVRVHSGAHRHVAAWLGGSVMATLRSARPLWVTAADYQEHGPDVVLQRCY